VKGMRDILIHDYSKTDIEILWNTVEKDLPMVKKTVGEMLVDLKR
jgi:uncharacterized protein with HEPN domain